MLPEDPLTRALLPPGVQANQTSTEHDANSTCSDSFATQDNIEGEAQLIEAEKGDKTMNYNPYPEAPLNCLRFPQILDTVLEHTDSWIPLRATCSAFKDRVDALFRRHIVLRQATRAEVVKARGYLGEVLHSVSALSVIARPEGRIPQFFPCRGTKRWDPHFTGTRATGFFTNTAVLDVSVNISLDLGDDLVLKDMPALKTLRIFSDFECLRTIRCLPTGSTSISKLVHLPKRFGHRGTSSDHDRCLGPLWDFHFVGTLKKTVINLICSECCGPSHLPMPWHYRPPNIWQPQPQTGHSQNDIAVTPASQESTGSPTSPYPSTEVIYILRIHPAVVATTSRCADFYARWRALFHLIANNLMSPARVKLVGLPEDFPVPDCRISVPSPRIETTAPGQMTAGVVKCLNTYAAWHQQRPESYKAVDTDEALSRLEYLSLNEYEATLQPGELAMEMEEIP